MQRLTSKPSDDVIPSLARPRSSEGRRASASSLKDGELTEGSSGAGVEYNVKSQGRFEGEARRKHAERREGTSFILLQET